MQLLADNLTQHVHETTRQNNILDLVISTEERIVNLNLIDKIGDHQAIQYSIKTENGNIASEKNTTYEEKNSMQYGLNLIDQTFEQPIVKNNSELGFEINRVNDASSRRHIPRRRATINNPSWVNNDVKQVIGRRQSAYEAKKMMNSEETIAEYIEARRQVKRIVKQE